MFFSSNIKLLRKRRGRTQDDVAHALEMKRSTLSGYENQVAQPGIDSLLAFSKYFNIAIDTLIRVDLSELSESQLSQVERGFDIYLKGSKLRVLATTVDNDNNENIELVNEKASAGYTHGFADPDFIRVLPTFQLPFLSRSKKYRAFQISGDSMIPIPDKSWVTGEYVENWSLLRTNYPYIVLTIDDGIVFKVVENRIKQDGKLRLISLNPLFETYEIEASQVKEVWKFVHYISSEMPEANMPKEKLMEEVQSLKRQVLAIQTKLSL
ncbi:MAG: LexA family transcriptional regulator [Bacteroidetes bacterium]|nr:LexA family transcriptional regulator [Bacteroidota bacterium]